jgi:hypothetical protein
MSKEEHILTVRLDKENFNQMFDNYREQMEGYVLQEQLYFEDEFEAASEMHRIVLANTELKDFTLRVRGEKTEEEKYPEIVGEKDNDLMHRIEDYNRVTKSSNRSKDRSRRSRKKEEGDKPKRKTRTTITQAKLDEMNRIFKEYMEGQEVKCLLMQKVKL